MGTTCSGSEYYLLQGVTGLPVEAEWASVLSRTQYTFTPAAVQCRVRSLLKRDEWEAPLSAYRGVLIEAKLEGEDSNSYRVVLKHEDRRQRDVVLYQSPSREMLRARLEECARLLGVPALTKTDDGLAARAPVDLDKSVRQRVTEGTLQVAFDPKSGPPGRHLSVSIEGNTLRLRSRSTRITAPVLVPVLLLGLAALLAGPLGIRYLRAVPAWLSVACFVGGVCGLGWQHLLVEELLVSPREVRRHLISPWGNFGEKALPAEEVEEVYVGLFPTGAKPRGGMGNNVEVVGDSGIISYGIALSKAQREWVRDCIIAVISK